ncbi:LOW QUALITY PROTEIN: protein FAR1-RELATED SEQUENCE 1 [Arachis duranensis]|uniref:LOW QUALITY PROTEIN: protein FAR1-RELATED SEQUENCE 1 n=1 Tax=Arachis duranensis TaxID=130453 RepID=A0A6P4B3E1_ARADU|nr:LOW QUALITY PROTEIN: protein FAR1-RELATED SEQUENCE 1 [Arachis duranensis]
MELGIDGSINGETIAHATIGEVSSSFVDEDKIASCSFDPAYKQDQDGNITQDSSVCNKEGYRMPDKREKIVRQRAETRVGCRAMILVRKVSSGKWVVTKFVKEHTHPLTPGKGRRDCIYEQYPNEHDKIRELSQQLAIEKKRCAAYKRQLELLFEHIEEHNNSLSKKIQHIVGNVKEIEAEEQQRHR